MTLLAETDTTAPLRWATIEQAEGSVRAIAVMRIALGVVTLLHLRPFLGDARASVSYTDHFWEPFIGWLPELPDGAWFAMLWLGAAAAVLMAVGLWTRLATVVAFAVVAGNVLLSQTHFRHNRAFLAILLGGLALLPAGRVLSLDAWWRRRRGRPTPPAVDRAPLWPVWMLRAQVCLVYLASGVSKLVDPDWIDGLVLWDRVVRYRHVLEPTPIPEWGIDLLTSRSLYYVVAPAAVAIELFVGVGLWSSRTRLAAIWVAVVFHLSIEVSAKVEVFSYAAIAALAIWVTPRTRDRVLLVPGDGAAGRGLAGFVRVTDWFGRFRVERTAAEGSQLTVVDRDGAELHGADALTLVASRLPVTFLFAAPFRLASLRRRRRRPLPTTAPDDRWTRATT